MNDWSSTSAITLLITTVVFTAAGLVKGVVGLGLPTLSMALLALVMTPAQAAALLILPSLVTNVWQTRPRATLGPLLKRLAGMQAGVVAGTLAGAWWLGTVLAVAGGSWMVIGSAEQLHITAWGVGLCLVSGLSYAAYTLISKRMVTDIPAAIVTLCIFGCAALFAVPAAMGLSGLPGTSARGWAVVVYLGVVATGVAYLLFTHALTRISGTTAVSMCLAEPLTAFGLAIAVIGERPPAAAFAGLALVMLGLALVVRAELRSAAP